jgi:hypothetical protein
VVACGGRGLADSIYDEGGGGTSVEGGRSGEGGATSSGGRTNMVSGGSPNVASGGRRNSSGGVTGAGGRASASGGAVASGGAATTPPESCRRFCKQLVADCGIQLQVDDGGCRSSCEQGFSSGSSTCEKLRIEALACVENALAQPMTTCRDVSRILSRDCLLPLALSATCSR